VAERYLTRDTLPGGETEAKSSLTCSLKKRILEVLFFVPGSIEAELGQIILPPVPLCVAPRSMFRLDCVSSLSA
jgi:hypothetical protein